MKNLGLSINLVHDTKVTVANGTTARVLGSVDMAINLKGKTKVMKVYILPCLSVPCIAGKDFLTRFALLIDTRDNAWSFSSDPGVRYTFERESKMTERIRGVCALNEWEKDMLKQFLDKEFKLFDPISGCTNLVSHHIDVGTNTPIKQRYYPVNPRIQEVINQEVDRLLREDIIEPSQSSWSSPVVVVRKGDGKYRFCLDFRKVNAVSKKDAYPLPYMSAILDKLRSAKYLTKIDLHQAYFQIPLDEASKEITAFTVPGRGLFQFKRMPFGLTGAPATFQRLLDRLIGPEMEPHCFAYLDDIIIVTETFEHHLRVLSEVFQKLRSAGLQINRDKCEWCCPQIRYLGFIINEHGLSVDPEKVGPVVNYPVPRNIQQLRRFLGMASWYRRFVGNFSSIIAPLRQLLKKGVKWRWGQEQQRSFEKIKEYLTTTPVLASPDFNETFYLQTDASSVGLGAVLTQFFDGAERVIAYASRSLTAQELKYSVTEKECLSVLWSIEKFRVYLEGYHFVVITDHSSLRWLHKLNNPNGRLARWSLSLQGYDFEVRHRKGSEHVVPDALSRIPECIDLVNSGAVESLSADPWYNKRFGQVQNNPANYPDWKIENGELYVHRAQAIDHLLEGSSCPWKLCIPKERVGGVLKENHDTTQAGHLGVEKTCSRIKQLYYWPGLVLDVARYVGRCDICQRFKVEQRRPAGKMGTREVQEPWLLVATDIMGPLVRSSKGNQYIIVFQDLFTKWVELRAVRHATAETVKAAFRELVILRWGAPKFLVSDNGPQYVNRIMSQLAEDHGILLSFTPPYHPQANPVERVNRVLKTMISSFVKENHKKWDMHLNDFCYAMNSAVHSSTGYSPALLNFGRELHICRSERSTREVTDAVVVRPVKEWVGRLRNLKELHDLVQCNLTEAYCRQGKYYNLRHRDREYFPGDLVLKRNFVLSSAAQNFSSKLSPKFVGPYRILRSISRNVYELETDQGQSIGKWHVKDLKPYLSPNT